MLKTWCRQLAANPPMLPAGLFLAGALLLATMAGLPPWRSLRLLPEFWPALRLVGFWTGVAALAVAGYGFAASAWARWHRAGTGRWRWPWTAAESGVALLLAFVVLGISGETLPANIIKLSGFHILLPGLAVLVMGTYRAGDWGFPSGTTRTVLMLGGVTAVCLLGTSLMSEDLPRSALLLNRLWMYGAWFAILGAVLRPGPGLEHLLRFLVTLGLAVTGYGIMQHFGLDWAVWGRGFSLPEIGVPGRAMSTFGNPNFYGAFLAVIIPLALGRGLTASGWKSRAGWGMTAVVLGVGLLFTYNRSGYLAVAAAGVLLFWLLPVPRRTVWFIAVALLLGLLLGPGSARERVFFWRNGLSGDDQIRCAIWRAAMAMALDRPLLGHGVGSFNQISQRYLPDEFHAIFPEPKYVIEHAHSELLEWWAEAGAVGSALLAALLLAVAMALWRRRKGAGGNMAAIALATMAAAATHGLFETKVRYESTMVPLLFAVAAALVCSRPAAAVRPRLRPSFAAGCVLAVLIVMQALLWLRANQEAKFELDYLLAGNWPEARQAVGRALRFDPDNLQLQYKDLYYRAKMNGPAAAVFAGNGPLPIVASYQDGALLLAKVLAVQGRYDRALACTNWYQTLHPRDDRTRLVQAEILDRAACPRGVLEVLGRHAAAGRGLSEQMVGLQAQAWFSLGWPDRARAEYELAVQGRELMITPRLGLLAIALEKKDLAQAFAIIAELLPRLRRENLTPPVRRLLERFVNQMLTTPESGKQYAVITGDLLAALAQHEQAKIVYLRVAARLGVEPQTVWSRVGWLGLLAGDVECLTMAENYFASAPGTRLTAAYLRARRFDLTGQTDLALAEYAALLEQQPNHLGALARLARMAPDKLPANLRASCVAAEAALGVPLTQICDTEPRWVVAARPATADTVARTVWITPLFPDVERIGLSTSVRFADGSEYWGAGAFRRVAAGETFRMAVPGPLVTAVPTIQPAAEQTLFCYRTDEVVDVRAVVRIGLGPTVMQLAPYREAEPRRAGAADSLARAAEKGYRAWCAATTDADYPAGTGVLRAAIGAAIESWRNDALAAERWRKQVGRFAQYAAAQPQWQPLADYVSRPEHGFLFELVKMSCQPGRNGAAASIALLDHMVRNGMTDFPDFLWVRPYRQGCDDAYWERWRKARVWREANFRKGIAEVLLESGRYREAIAWLAETPGTQNRARWQLARAWHGLDQDDKAAGMFAAVPAEEQRQATYQWDYGRWLQLCGKPASVPAGRLAQAGARAWAWFLQAGMAGVPDQQGHTVEFEDGLVLGRIGTASGPLPPRALFSGQRPELYLDFLPTAAGVYPHSVRIFLPGARIAGGVAVAPSEGVGYASQRPGDWCSQVELQPLVPTSSLTLRTAYWLEAAILHSPELVLPLLPRRRQLAAVATAIPLPYHCTFLPFGRW